MSAFRHWYTWDWKLGNSVNHSTVVFRFERLFLVACLHIWREISEWTNLWDPEKENMQGKWCLMLRLGRAHGMRHAGVSKLPMHTNRFPREAARVNKGSKSFYIIFSYFWRRHAKSPLVQTMHKWLWWDREEEKSLEEKRECTGKEVIFKIY